MTQILPATDDFAWGSPAFGANVIGWLGARLSTSTFQAGRLHDGYGGAAARSDDQADTTGATVGFIRRQTPAADVRVAVTSQKIVLSGAPANAQLKTHAVIARLTAGTLAGNATSSVRLQACTCYALTVEWIASPGLWRYKLKRFAAGTATDLATFEDPTSLVSMFTAPIRLTLEVVTNGDGDVELRGYVANASLGASSGGSGPGGAHVVWQAGGAGGLLVSTDEEPISGTPLKTGPFSGAPPDFPDAGDTLILEFTDDTGSKITAAGRAGLGLDPERDIASPASHSVSVATLFEVWDLTDLDAPVLFLRDEFERVAPLLAEAMTDRFGTAGRNVASDWTCDQASTAVTGKILVRSTGEEAAQAPLTADMGKAITLNGTNDYLELQNAENTYPSPALPAATQITIACWAKVTLLAGGKVILDAAQYASINDGFTLILEGTTGAQHMRFYGGFSGSPLNITSDAFDLADYAGQTFCFVGQFKANANPVTGEGRCRFYIGRLGVATLISEEVVAADIRPQWQSTGTHLLGAKDAIAANTFFPGVIDELNVFFRELTPAEVGQVCDANTDPALYPPMGLVAGWHFDEFTNVGGGDPKRWAPYFAAVTGGISLNSADWFREKNGVSEADPGLVPVAPSSRFVALSQRAASNTIGQSRTLTFHPAGPTSTGGLILRAGPGAEQDTFTGYQLLVAPGAPARVVVLRVIDGVPTAMAEQDPSSGTVNVAADTDAELGFSVAQQVGGGVSGPVALTVTIDGDLVPMVSLQVGLVLIGLDGAVVDTADDRILSGVAEGFHGFIDGTASRFDTWAPGEEVATADPSTFASYPVPAEDDGVTGDLGDVLTPAWEIEIDYPASLQVMPFDSGHGERRIGEAYVHRRFRLQLLGGSDDEISALREFWDDHGAVIPFSWDPSSFLDGQVAGVFCFEEDKMPDSFEAIAATSRSSWRSVVPLEIPAAFKLLKSPLFQGDEWIWLAEIRSPDDGPIISPDGTQSILRLARRTSPVTFGVNVETGVPLEWSPWPFKIDALPQDAQGNVNELNVSFANGPGTGDALMHDNAYLRGHKVLLHIVHSSMLDQPNSAMTFVGSVIGGSVSWEAVSLRLSAFGLLDFSVPSRLMTRKCSWRYRGKGCGFIGDPGNAELGACAFTVEACELRGQWEADNGLVVAHPGNFGGWPSLIAGPMPTKLT